LIVLTIFDGVSFYCNRCAKKKTYCGVCNKHTTLAHFCHAL
jgi:hypothetical protein